jgi:hypothetical protein
VVDGVILRIDKSSNAVSPHREICILGPPLVISHGGSGKGEGVFSPSQHGGAQTTAKMLD